LKVVRAGVTFDRAARVLPWRTLVLPTGGGNGG
jgi:hypothetical protein